jgi:hypothetical protein
MMNGKFDGLMVGVLAILAILAVAFIVTAFQWYGTMNMLSEKIRSGKFVELNPKCAYIEIELDESIFKMRQEAGIRGSLIIKRPIISCTNCKEIIDTKSITIGGTVASSESSIFNKNNSYYYADAEKGVEVDVTVEQDTQQ